MWGQLQRILTVRDCPVGMCLKCRVTHTLVLLSLRNNGRWRRQNCAAGWLGLTMRHHVPVSLVYLLGAGAAQRTLQGCNGGGTV